MLNLIKFVPMSLLGALARFASYLAKWSNASIYRSICTNLMLVRPSMDKDERDRLAFTILQNQLTSTLNSAKSWAMPPKWSIAQIKTVHNREILERGFANPKGLILVAPHIGTWEMMNAWLCGFGDLTIMYKPSGNPSLDRFILSGRERLSATLVPTDSTGVKAIFKTLKSGGFTVILPDHVPDKNGGEIVPFFGIPTMTGTLTTKLAQKTGCALVGLACIKGKDGFEIFCYDLTDPNLYDKNDIIATTTLNNSMEMMINKHFAHYMWGYRRFKTTPFGENPYLLPFDDLHAQIKSYKIDKNKENP
ncbi:lysophospholipid acyltransferase family protein [Moraxella bovis]|uniref:lysophospholipid acyltransferase family protein n=1 Tax=Moraxella bovis TaxID=476 RepID=UPI0009939546|nr:lysophospholipid acyltransferase family protein [Moraxella bovis]OOR88452.1 lipid A biosynthesis acyltransferase [Moraxella bovis]UZA17961.1 lysophospholipid acyltransferase family protein [Moraxella bovis]